MTKPRRKKRPDDWVPPPGDTPTERHLAQLKADGEDLTPYLDQIEDKQSYVRERFIERAIHDFDRVYDAIIRTALGTDKMLGDPRSQKMFLEYLLVKPDTRDNSLAAKMFERVLEKAMETRPAEVNERYVDST